MELAVIKAELEQGREGGSGINDSANGCAVETVDPDGTPSLSSVFITLQGTEGEKEGAVSGAHSSNLSLHLHLGCTSSRLRWHSSHPDTSLHAGWTSACRLTARSDCRSALSQTFVGHRHHTSTYVRAQISAPFHFIHHRLSSLFCVAHFPLSPVFSPLLHFLSHQGSEAPQHNQSWWSHSHTQGTVQPVRRRGEERREEERRGEERRS